MLENGSITFGMFLRVGHRPIIIKENSSTIPIGKTLKPSQLAVIGLLCRRKERGEIFSREAGNASARILKHSLFRPNDDCLYFRFKLTRRTLL